MRYREQQYSVSCFKKVVVYYAFNLIKYYIGRVVRECRRAMREPRQTAKQRLNKRVKKKKNKKRKSSE